PYSERSAAKKKAETVGTAVAPILRSKSLVASPRLLHDEFDFLPTPFPHPGVGSGWFASPNRNLHPPIFYRPSNARQRSASAPVCCRAPRRRTELPRRCLTLFRATLYNARYAQGLRPTKERQPCRSTWS